MNRVTSPGPAAALPGLWLCCDAILPDEAELVLDRCGQVPVERLEAALHGAADPPRGDGADAHPLDFVRPRCAVGDVRPRL